MAGDVVDSILDSDWLFLLVVLALPVVLLAMQWRLVAHTEGVLRWVAAAPSLILVTFILLNVVAPSNIWPIALTFWTVVAFSVHLAVWLLLKLIHRPA